MADKTDSKRLLDLRSALKKAKPRDTLSLSACAALWGVTKPRFVNKRAEIAKFPDFKEKIGNEHHYPALKTLRAMIGHIEGHRENDASRAKRIGKLIGNDQMAAHISGSFSIAELARANQLAAEIETRERESDEWERIAVIAREVGLIFSDLSEFMSNLANDMDPHGLWVPEMRAQLDARAHEKLLEFHSKIKHRLTRNAFDTGTGEPPRAVGKSPAHGKTKRSNPRKA